MAEWVERRPIALKGPQVDSQSGHRNLQCVATKNNNNAYSSELLWGCPRPETQLVVSRVEAMLWKGHRDGLQALLTLRLLPSQSVVSIPRGSPSPRAGGAGRGAAGSQHTQGSWHPGLEVRRVHLAGLQMPKSPLGAWDIPQLVGDYMLCTVTGRSQDSLWALWLLLVMTPNEPRFHVDGVKRMVPFPLPGWYLQAFTMVQCLHTVGSCAAIQPLTKLGAHAPGTSNRIVHLHTKKAGKYQSLHVACTQTTPGSRAVRCNVVGNLSNTKNMSAGPTVDPGAKCVPNRGQGQACFLSEEQKIIKVLKAQAQTQLNFNNETLFE